MAAVQDRTHDLNVEPIEIGIVVASIVVVGAIVHAIHRVDVFEGAPGVALGILLVRGRRYLARRKKRAAA